MICNIHGSNNYVITNECDSDKWLVDPPLQQWHALRTIPSEKGLISGLDNCFCQETGHYPLEILHYALLSSHSVRSS